MRFRSLAIGLTLLASGTIIGAATTQFASAGVSSGDKPILVPLEPCRLVDTRPGDATIGPRSSPLGAADTLTVDAQESGTPCTGVIPADALALALNVTALNATQQTFLTIWAGGARPDASSLNPAPGAPPTPNAVTVDLSADQEFEVYNDVGSVNVIIDITGYYVDHNHDDRYAMRSEVEVLAAQVASPVLTPGDAFTLPAGGCGIVFIFGIGALDQAGQKIGFWIENSDGSMPPALDNQVLYRAASIGRTVQGGSLAWGEFCNLSAFPKSVPAGWVARAGSPD